jgi:hypothetical protein
MMVRVRVWANKEGPRVHAILSVPSTSNNYRRGDRIMSTENTAVGQVLEPVITPEQTQAQEPEPAPAPKKVFTVADVKRHITVKVHLPFIYPDYEPWEFDLRLKLSQDAEERRQQYLALSAAQQTIKLEEQALDEVCDLLVSLPRGFGDLQAIGNNPGKAFEHYVKSITDPDARQTVFNIVKTAEDFYWGMILPREFRG